MKEAITKNLGYKILALFIAFFAWLIVLNIEDPIQKKTFNNVPVTVVNAEIVTNQGKTYQVSESTRQVSVSVRAKNSVLKKIRTDDIKATADMAEIQNRTSIPIEVVIPEYSGKYQEAVASPRNVQVSIEASQTKTFAITPATNGTVRSGSMIGSIAAIPEKVELSGPETLINSIDKVVATADVSGLSKDAVVDANMVFYDVGGKLVDATQIENNLGEEGVKITVSMLYKKTLTIELDDSEITAATGYEITGIAIEPKSIEILGTTTDLETIDKITIPAEAVALKDLKENVQHSLDITSYLPEWAKTEDATSAKTVVVSVSVTKEGTKKFDFPLASISVLNAPKGYTVSYSATGNIQIVVVGLTSKLDSFELDSGSVSINLANIKEAGTYSLPLQVTLPSGIKLDKQINVEVVLTGKKTE